MIVVYVMAGLFGSLIGSFLNVVIYRLPRGMPMGMERSKCPECSNQIAWFDNIPVFSWLALRARCRACRARIPWRYPAVELLTAILFVACVDRTLALSWTPLAAGFFVTALFCSALVALAFIDLDLGILPDSLTLRTLLPTGVLASIVVPNLHGTALFGHDLAEGMKPGMASLLVGAVAAALAYAIMLAVTAVGRRGTPVDAGPEGETAAHGGDPDGPQRIHARGEAKFGAGIGLTLGPVSMLYAVGIALVLAAVVGAIRFRMTTRRALPLGPFLALGAVTALFYGGELARMLGAG